MLITIAAGALTFAFTTVLTIAGVGAAFILIPVFVTLGIELHVAMATALLLNSVAMAIASVRNARKRMIDYRAGLPVIVAAVVLSPLGAWVSRGMNRGLLLALFVLFLLFAAAMMLFYVPRARAAAAGARRIATEGGGVGAVAGFVGGLLGVGGGNVIMPALVSLGFEPRRASATTSFAVLFASAAGFLGHASLAGMDGRLAVMTGIGAGTGALVGSYLMTERLQGAQVKKLLAVVLVAVAVKMAYGMF